MPQFEEIRHFRRLLSHALGEHFTVESSLKKRFCLEIVPVNRIYFSQDAISVLQEFFTNHRADLCVAELKENLSKLTLLQCDAPAYHLIPLRSMTNLQKILLVLLPEKCLSPLLS